jgi:hypothetical protein
VSQQHLGDLGHLLREHRRRPRLDDARLLARDHHGPVAEVLRVVDGDGEHRGDLAVGHVGGVPDTTHPDLDDRDVDRRVRERGVRHPDDGLEERQRMWLRRVDQVRVRRHVVERAHELLVGQGGAVDADPLAHLLDVRAGEPAGAQVQGPQQGVDHA